MRKLVLLLALLPLAAFARDWNVDMAKSGLGFDGTYQGGPFAGMFKKFSARSATTRAISHNRNST